MNDSFNDKPNQSLREKRLGLLLWFYLSRFFNYSVRLSNAHLKEWELSIAQFDVLVQIGANQRLTQKELGHKLLVTKGNVTQLLSKLEKWGLIKREREWKTKYLSLTEKGEALYQDVVPKQETVQASHFDNLNQNEQQQLVHLLKKLYKGKKREEDYT